MPGIRPRIAEAAEKLREKLSAEEMTPLERMRAAGSFREADRVPVILQIHEYAARIAGMRVEEICRDPEMTNSCMQWLS